jgi:hypothetical protein
VVSKIAHIRCASSKTFEGATSPCGQSRETARKLQKSDRRDR